MLKGLRALKRRGPMFGRQLTVCMGPYSTNAIRELERRGLVVCRTHSQQLVYGITTRGLEFLAMYYGGPV